MRLTMNLRAAQSRLESIRSVITKDISVLEGAFEAVKAIAPDIPTRSVAEMGRFYAEWLAAEINEKITELHELLEMIDREAGERTK